MVSLKLGMQAICFTQIVERSLSLARFTLHCLAWKPLVALLLTNLTREPLQYVAARFRNLTAQAKSASALSEP